MYLCVGVGVIGSIYLYIEGWALLVQYTCARAHKNGQLE